MDIVLVVSVPSSHEKINHIGNKCKLSVLSVQMNEFLTMFIWFMQLIHSLDVLEDFGKEPFNSKIVKLNFSLT